MKKLINNILIIFLFAISVFAEEGMYPLSEIKNLDLKKLGFNISQSDLYNPNGVSLITALVNLSGCTGSFVSENGLILTNHHCAYGAISRASSIENNYLENGFAAQTLSEEVEAKGITARIIESYKDVSEEILSAVKDIKNDAERRRAIKDKMQEITAKNTDEENDITAIVAEMLPGKSYVLFLYKTIYDIRLVYAPPQSIGNFGGEEDNWIWPRHTGDFTFLRAYVNPNGKSTKYDVNNIPYKPKKYIKINLNGLKENDFTFILGYPGRTFRHQPAQFLTYQFNYLLPLVAELNGKLIHLYEELSAENDSLKLEYAPIIKSLANTYKNYKGKLLGIKRLNLLNKKIETDNELKNFIYNNNLGDDYKNLFDNFNNIYQKKYEYAEGEIIIERLSRFSNFYNALEFLLNYKNEIEKPDSLRSVAYKEKNLDKTINSFYTSLSNIDLTFEKRIFTMLFDKLNKLNTKNSIFNYIPYKSIEKENGANFINTWLNKTILAKDGESLMGKSENDLLALNDSLVILLSGIKKYKDYVKENNDAFEGALARLLPVYVDAKMKYENKKFIPDANSTLRLTFGRVVGYSPADATYYKPFTTLSGVIDKSYRGEYYKIPEKLYELNKTKFNDKFFSKDLNDIPVAFLYNMDTTGGNSGSPVLNADGQLVGLNFDRAFEATINDFTWSAEYSRSIGVDIRYILYITKNLNGGNYLLKELNVN